MRRVLAGLLVWLIPATVAAGGGGILKLARPLETVAAGETVLYVQALQHGEHPLGEALVGVSAVGPDGTRASAPAVLDARYGSDHVYAARLTFPAPGQWQVRIEAHHWVQFPPLSFSVNVLPAGSKVPDPGPVTPRHTGAQSHSHGAPAAGTDPAPASAPASAPAGRPGLWWTFAAGAALGALATAGTWAVMMRRLRMAGAE